MDADVAESLGPSDPREIGQFTIIGLLGAGGMGEVYLGTREGRYVAVKRVKPRLVSGERFNREVAILHRVPFGVAPTLLASDSTAPEPWFATEYVPGLTVDDAIRSYGPFGADALWLLLAETSAHLQAVHEAGIVHRDLKPANIMLVRDGVKLIDFGIAMAEDQARLTRIGASSGTRGFTAPEQEAGDREVAAPADVYSLAATVVYAASGRLPGFVADVGALRAVDAGLAGVVEACLAADPGARPTAAELVAAAREHARAVGPEWPAAVMERIAKRRAFAATPVSVIETVLPGAAEVGTEAEAGPTEPLGEDGAKTGAGTGARAGTVAGAGAGTGTGTGARSRAGVRRLLVPLATVFVLCGAAAGVLALVSSHGHSGHSPSAATSIGGVPLAETVSSSGSSGSSASGGSSSGLTSASATGPSASGTTSGTGPNSRATTPNGSAPSSKHGGSTPSRPVGSSTAPTTTSPSTPGPGTTHPAPSPTPTASSIPGIDSDKDPARVPNSEADAAWVANDATCSAWLDSDGRGGLAGVLNTSLEQSCVAEIIRSDGLTFTFSSSQGAEKTNFLPDQGYTMEVCVWHADEKDGEKCSPQFGMSGTTPVQR